MDQEEEDNLEEAREGVFKEVIEEDFKIKEIEVDFKIKVTEVKQETIILEEEENNNLFDKYNLLIINYQAEKLFEKINFN